MNKKFTKLIAAMVMLLTMMAMPMKTWAQQREQVTLWSEDFSGYSANDVPTGGTYSYVCTNGTGSNSPGATKIWNEKLAGSSAPELLVGNTGGTNGTGGTFSATIPLNNIEGTLTLTYYQNAQTLSVSSTTSGVSGGQTLKPSSAGQQTTTFEGITTSMTSITIVFQATTTKNVRLDEIVLTGTQVSSYTITAQSNNTEWGTVNLSGTTITATPAEGYRVSTETPYEVTPAGSATVTQNGNSFSVAATSDCTVQINFEELPSHTLNTAVIPTDAGTVTLGSTSVIEGTTTTATAVANAGFKFVNWSIEGTGASLSSNTDNPTTVTMGSSDAIITANFASATTFAISYSVNGTIVETKNVEENTPIDFSAPTSGVPSGFVFQGWVNEPVVGTQNTAPTYVTPTNATSNVTYYAVMAMLLEGGDDTYEKLDNQSFDANATYVIGAEQASTNNTMWYLYSYSKVDANSSWGVMTSNPASNAPITFTLSGTASALVAMDNSGNYLKGLTTGNFHMSSTSTTIAINESGAIQNATNNNYKLRHNYNNGAGGLRWYSGTTGTQAYFYKVVPGNVYGNYCTTVTNTFTTEGSWNDATNWSLGIVPAEGYSVTIGAACEIPASCIAQVNTITIGGTGSLTIVDGGQLICNNNPTVTVQKGITGYGDDNTVKTGWYFIASPIDDEGLGVSPSDITNMISASHTYDLYELNQSAETGLEWENYKYHQNDFVLNNGHGYLYASSETVSLEFDGAIKPANADIEISLDYDPEAALAGWNLVGNPFTFNAYVNRSYYTMTTTSNTPVAVNNNAAIPPCTGILVQAMNESDNSVIFTQTDQSNASKGNLQMTVAQQATNRGTAATLDNAIVSFNEDSQLEKFYFMEQNANLYIPQNGKDYAIAAAEEAQGEMPVNFKVRENGTYTLTVNPENVEMGYLHLIDNMTGDDIDLLQTPSYTFNATTRDYESRFRLVFSANGENGASTGSATFAFISDGNLIVNNEGEATLQVVDLTGRILSSETIDGCHSMSMNAAPGVYMIRLINGNNVKVQKIVVR